MNFLRQWFNTAFPRHRLMPTIDDVKGNESLYMSIPQELVETWLEQNNLSNPQSTDPYVCVAWAARCDFVESIVKIRDRVQNPEKYPELMMIQRRAANAN